MGVLKILWLDWMDLPTYIDIEKARIFWPYKLKQMYGKYTSPMDGMGKICFKQTNWAWQVFLFG